MTLSPDPLEGCWQVVYDDPEDQFVAVEGTWTNVSLRRSGFTVYGGGHFVHIRTDSGRRLATSWPPSDEDKIHYFRTATGAAGTVTWTHTTNGWVGEHTITMSPDPREHGTTFEYWADVEDGTATVRNRAESAPVVQERWRRLSGAGRSPLAGAWESSTAQDSWLLVVTAGHYGVVRESIRRNELPPTGTLTDEQVLSVFDGYGSNAGAIVETATSFDNHPFVATNSAGYDAAKHPSFSLASIDDKRMTVGFKDDGTDAEVWSRVG